MPGIKKLDLYILRKFLLLFVAAFFICLFVFMMQFTWRYIDELVGKGLTVTILVQFFWYMGLSLIPTSLPLAVLLSSLITFGNMGEELELLSMKAAGVSLLRVMRPVALVVILITGVSFYFQNKTAPEATISMRTLLISMKQTSPAVEIPEGVFYNGVPGVNLYVQKKDAETGMLYQVIIYKTDQGFDRAQIVLADSGHLEMTADKLHLVLDLWNGEQFENLQSGSNTALGKTHVPYDRETFGYKRLLIDFDSNFSLMDAAMLHNMAETKNLRQIEEDVDSMNRDLDSLGRENLEIAQARWLARRPLPEQDSVRVVKALGKTGPKSFDELLASTPPERLQEARQNCRSMVASGALEWENRGLVTGPTNQLVRRHWKEWHQKFTLSLACIFFFFIGAPLGAIIRKGGLGLPTVISVFIFIIYYIINTSGMKMARDGSIHMVLGMWISTAILVPVGVWLTYKANKDSTVFNGEVYIAKLRNLLGLRSKRHLVRKEVIIDDPDYPAVREQLTALRQACTDYRDQNKLMRAPGYLQTFLRPRREDAAAGIGAQLESLVETLGNSREHRILAEVNKLPTLFTRAHLSPLRGRRSNIVAGLLLPIGLLIYLRMCRFRLILWRDMKQVIQCCDALLPLVEKEITREQAAGEPEENSTRPAAAT